MVKSKKAENIAAWIEGVLLFCIMKPYFLWTFFDNNYLKLSVVFLSCLIFFVFMGRLKKKEKIMMALYVFIYILYFITNTNWIVVFSLFLFLVPFAKDSFYKNTLDSFYSIYCVFVGLGLIVWNLHLLGYLEPYAIIEQSSELRENPFEVYPLVVCEMDMFGVRYGACFDEPGVVGTMSVLFLMARPFKIKDWKSWVVFISGVYSLSFFFFGALAFYLVYYSVVVKKNVFFVIFAALVVLFAFAKTHDDPLMEQLVWRRFEFDKSEGKFAGDNRISEYADQYYKKNQWTSEYWFGVRDWEKFWNLAAGGSSYKIVVMRNGMIFFGLYTLWFLLYARQRIKKRKFFLLYCLMYLATVYQRTNLYDPVFTFLFIYIARTFGQPTLPEINKKMKTQKLIYESTVDNKY